MQVQGQHPHQWAPFQIAGLLHALQISHQISRYSMSIMRVDGQELPLSAIPLCQLFPCHLGPPRPTLSINLYVKGCLDCTIGAVHMSIPSESSLLQKEVQILNAKMPSRTSSSLDNVVTMSCGLTLQSCQIITLSFRCRCWRFGFVNGQVSLAWSIALRIQELYTRPHVLKGRWREERTGSRSLNFFQAVFTCVVVESSQPPAAESMSPKSQKEATTSSLSGPTWTSFCGLPSKGRAVPWHYVHL